MALLRRLRDRLYADPRFQRWAASFPLTRAIARRNAAAVFDLTAGFVYSRVLEACLRLDLLERLREGPMDSASLAAAIELPVEGCERLLAAAAGIELVERRSAGRWGLGRLGAMVLGNPGLESMVLHHRLFHRDLGDVVALLRRDADETELGAFWSYAGGGSPTDESAGGYSELMGDSLQMLADDVLDAHPLARHQHLMDVGGGDGSFLRAVAERAPELELTLFDLPAVARRASEREGPFRVVAGDLFHDPLPRGADCVSLVRLLLDHDDDGALRILQAVRRALPDGGTLVVAEPMSETGVPRVADTYFGLYLWAMGQGRTRSPTAIGALLREAGFRTHRAVSARRSVFCHLVVATA